jgi:hypothetical protein
MGYQVPWKRLPAAERQRRTAAGTAAKAARRQEFNAYLAQIEEENARREADYANQDYANHDLISTILEVDAAHPKLL